VGAARQLKGNIMAMTPSAGVKSASKKKATRGSIYTGIKSAQNRDPILTAGDYVVRVGECETEDGWFRAKLEVVTVEKERGEKTMGAGDVGVMLQGLNGKYSPGPELVRSFVLGVIGLSDDDFDDEKKYTRDQQDQVFHAVEGEKNEMSPLVDEHFFGCLVHVSVTRGNDVLDKETKEPTGDYYRNMSWTTYRD
jgi:hypothetical protein